MRKVNPTAYSHGKLCLKVFYFYLFPKPTLNPKPHFKGDVVLVNSWAVRQFEGINRGDIATLMWVNSCCTSVHNLSLPFGGFLTTYEEAVTANEICIKLT